MPAIRIDGLSVRFTARHDQSMEARACLSIASDNYDPDGDFYDRPQGRPTSQEHALMGYPAHHSLV
jgi:hypothetical protein